MIKTGKIRPGEKSPPENILQNILNVPRPQIRAAYRKLEIFGITRTKPQSGTYLTDFSPRIIEGLLTNLESINDSFDPLSLSDTRRTLEIRAAELAAESGSRKNILKIRNAGKIFIKHSLKSRAIEDDIFFHLQIINAAENTALRAAYCFLTPSFIKFWKDLDYLGEKLQPRTSESINEHEQIIQAIEERNPELAGKTMRKHLNSTYKTAISLYKNINERKQI